MLGDLFLASCTSVLPEVQLPHAAPCAKQHWVRKACSCSATFANMVAQLIWTVLIQKLCLLTWNFMFSDLFFVVQSSPSQCLCGSYFFSEIKSKFGFLCHAKKSENCFIFLLGYGVCSLNQAMFCLWILWGSSREKTVLAGIRSWDSRNNRLAPSLSQTSFYGLKYPLSLKM